MKNFLTTFIRFSYLILFSLILLFLLYFIFDPFKVLKNYSDYSNNYVISNRDYISTNTFINNYKKNKYNSFIFGSSRTLGFKPKSWKKYLLDADKPYVFDASGESVFGIYSKLKFLDSLSIPINNAIILLCRDVSFGYSENPKGHLFIKHPSVSKESKFTFHLEFIKAYFNPKFIFNYYLYTLTKRYEPFMNGYIEDRKITFDTITNELNIIDQENEIVHNPTAYYQKREDIFFDRVSEKSDSTQRITEKYQFYLGRIKEILEKKHTKYKVVLSPLYEQVKFNSNDSLFLHDLFGSNLYDFSGENDLTKSKINYYETNHFRPNVGDSILKKMYP
jgi:hypothetical protein